MKIWTDRIKWLLLGSLAVLMAGCASREPEASLQGELILVAERLEQVNDDRPPMKTESVRRPQKRPAWIYCSYDPPPPPGVPGEKTEKGLPERGPAGGIWETLKSDAKRSPEMLDDTGAVLVEPTNWLVLGMGGVISGVTRNNWDDRIAGHFERHHNHLGSDLKIAIGAAGNPGTHFAVAGALWLYGTLNENAESYEFSRSLFSSLIIFGVSNMGLKWAFRDESPNGEEYAFPSGHTGSTMTVAAVVGETYGFWAGLPLYLLTGLVAWERMETREHWFSDVIFGAAQGWVIGTTVAGRHRPQVLGWDIVPYVSPRGDTAGIGLMKRW